MKKIISFTLAISFLLLVFQLVVSFLKTGHDVEYELEIGNDKYKVEEIYNKSSGVDTYYLRITTRDKTFVVDVDNNFNKQKNILIDVKYYESGNLVCIYPIYMNNKTGTDLSCTIDGKLYSYEYVKKSYNLKEFIATLPNFVDEKTQSSDEEERYMDIDIYSNNIKDGEYIMVYNYKNLVRITNSSRSYIPTSKEDVYHNKLGRMIKNYFLAPTYDDVGGYHSIVTYNILDSTAPKVTFPDMISQNIYINGIVNDKLYLFDRSNIIQYEIDPFKRSYKIIGDKDKGGTRYTNGKWEDANIYNFVENDIIFTEDYSKYKSLNYKEIFTLGKYVYFYNNKGEFYKVYEQFPDSPILMFVNNNVKEVKVEGSSIYYIEKDTLYRYNSTGISKILKRNEFLYNSENIYYVYVE